MEHVLYVARAGLPLDAAGIRIGYIGQLLKELGYSVHYLCDKMADKQLFSSPYFRLTSDQCKEYGVKCGDNEVNFLYDGSVYSYLMPNGGTKTDAFIERIEFYTAKRVLKRIIRTCLSENISLIVFYNDANFLAKRLNTFCERNRIKTIGDVTEWYECRSSKTLLENMIAKFTDIRIRKTDQELNGVISISPFLHNYYQSIGVKSIFIPPLMSFDHDICEELYTRNKDEIRFVYAGSPGAKDIVLPFIQAVILTNKVKRRFRFDLVGVTYSQLINEGCQDACEENGIYAHGRLLHEETVKIVKKADFGILLRYNERYAKAGFSTKFAECMSLGVPMICNRIGGADAFVEDRIDGLLVESIDLGTLMVALSYIASLNTIEIARMKNNAKKKATELFDIMRYIEPMKGFLSSPSISD